MIAQEPVNVSGKLRILVPPRLEVEGRTRARLAELIELPFVRHIAGMPDLHYKTTMESPSSCAVATKDAIVPQFSSASLNCGMSVVTTGLRPEQLTDEFLRSFYDQLNRGYWIRVINKFGIARSRYELTRDELKQAYLHGARAVAQKYRLDEDTLAHIEHGGSLLSEEQIASIDLDRIVPGPASAKSQYNLGLGFAGNHFLEFQIVDEVLEHEAAARWGLKAGQVVLMYHTGPGIASTMLGRYYAGPRLKDSPKRRRDYFMKKLAFHMLNPDALVSGQDRWRNYFSGGLNVNDPATTEGQRLLISMAVAMNYGYAYRAGTFARVRDALAALVNDRAVRLVYDSSHNSIQRDTIQGEELWVHRHNACRVLPGDPAIISGYNNTSSFLGMGLAGAEASLFTVDHGAGETIKRWEKAGWSVPDKRYQTKRYVFKHHPRNEEYKVKEVDHVKSDAIDTVINILHEANIVAPVVRLRPVASLKN
jgi:tRNA-splicing ligase RtcB (3'-phosphate/5'-hydroxy nucleic acid ligase)